MYVLRWIKTLTLMKDRDRSGVFWGWGFGNWSTTLKL